MCNFLGVFCFFFISSLGYYWFFKFIFNWKIIALLCSVGFYHATMWISSKYTYYLLHSEPHFHPTAPYPSPLGCHRAPGWTPWAIKQLSIVIYSTHGNACISVLLFQFVPPSPSLSVHTSLFSTSAFLFLPLKEVHQGYFSRFHTYVLIYNICFSLPELPHCV